MGDSEFREREDELRLGQIEFRQAEMNRGMACSDFRLGWGDFFMLESELLSG